MQQLAPIALFVYNRPGHTERTLTFLKKNTLAADSRLYVFSDGARGHGDAEQVAEVRACISRIDGFKSVEIITRKENLGLAENIITGVSKLVNEYGQVIVLEDDLITSPHTLEYFNQALAKYKDNPEVMHIGAYMYPKLGEDLPETFFYRAATSWGWATWARAWAHFEPDIDVLMRQFDAPKQKAFSIDGTMNFWKQMKEFKKGKNNSWAIRWYASIFLQGGLTLNPAHSLVNNIGHDGTGVHSGINEIYNVIIHPKPVSYFPDQISEDVNAYQAIRRFLAQRKGSFFQRIQRYLHQFLNSARKS